MTPQVFVDKAVRVLDRWDREKNRDRDGVMVAVEAVDLLVTLLPPALRALDSETRAVRAFLPDRR